MPPEVRAWFDGVPRPTKAARYPWAVLAFPGYALLPLWWQDYVGEHSDAVPPAGFEWLADLSDPRHSELARLRERAGMLQTGPQ